VFSKIKYLISCGNTLFKDDSLFYLLDSYQHYLCNLQGWSIMKKRLTKHTKLTKVIWKNAIVSIFCMASVSSMAAVEGVKIDLLDVGDISAMEGVGNGDAFTSQCSSGEVLVGLTVYHNQTSSCSNFTSNLVRGVEGVCAPIDVNYDTKYTLTTGSKTTLSRNILSCLEPSKPSDPVVGVQSQTLFTCPDGQVVKGINTFGGNTVESLKLLCASPSVADNANMTVSYTEGASSPTFGASSAHYPPYNWQCNSGVVDQISGTIDNNAGSLSLQMHCKDIVLSTYDLDDDADGIINDQDAFPHDATEHTDSDGDGVGDNKDYFNNDASQTLLARSLLETGAVTLSTSIDNGVATHIDLKNTYLDPVVLVFVTDSQDKEPLAARALDVTNNAFKLLVEKADGSALKGAVNISYLVVEKGRHVFANGLEMQAGLITTTNVHVHSNNQEGADSVIFTTAFSATPVVLHSLNSYNNSDFMESRVDSVTAAGFNVEQEASGTGSGVNSEKIAWVAFNKGDGLLNGFAYEINAANDGANDGITNTAHAVDFSSFGQTPAVIAKGQTSNGGDGFWSKGDGLSANAISLYAEEDTVLRSEQSHMDETFGWAAFSKGTMAWLRDFDADGIDDAIDNDDDGDFINDSDDVFPMNASANTDTDNDGLPDSCFSTCTGGLIADNDDDDDGVIDSLDSFPRNASASLDTDHDGLPDSCITACTGGLVVDNDDDNDSIVDSADSFPLNASASIDTDNDGLPDSCITACTGGLVVDNDDDNDSIVDSADSFPLNALASLDTDNDGLPDSCITGCTGGLVVDNDDDDDGIVDSADSFPLNASASLDTDNDGLPDSCITACTGGLVADNDDDNDSIVDSADSFPLNASASIDTDNDGLPDSCITACTGGLVVDNDDDNDSIVDSADSFPLNAAASLDTDNNGFPEEWNANCDLSCQQSSGLLLDGLKFADANLEKAIRSKLGNSSEPILENDVKSITLLTLGNVNAPVSDLSGIESLTKLTTLILSSQTITDLAPLSSLTELTSLELSNSDIGVLSTISTLTSLRSLRIINNELSDLNFLTGLSSLRVLTVERTKLSDISALSGLTNITDLFFSYNSISDISALSGLTKMKALYLSYNSISDISALSNFTQLFELDLTSNHIVDISPLSNLTALVDLFLDNNEVEDVASLASLSNLRNLGLTNNQINDYSGFALLTQVTDLYMQETNITDSDLTYLTGMVNLSSLDLQNSVNLTNISPLVQIPNLKRLYVDNSDLNFIAGTSLGQINFDALNQMSENGTYVAVSGNLMDMKINFPSAALEANIKEQLGFLPSQTIMFSSIQEVTSLRLDDTSGLISDLTGLEYFSSLTNLMIKNHMVTDLNPLSGLIKLEQLVLNNMVSNPGLEVDLSPLRSLTNLTELIIYGGYTYDISALSNLTNLIILDLTDNHFTDLSPLISLTSLETLTLAKNPAIENFSVLSNLMNLKGLDISHNNIEEINFVAALNNLEKLNASYNNIVDISPLSNLINLTLLSLTNNYINDISKLNRLSNLHSLYLATNNISDVRVLMELSSVVYLSLSANPINDFSSLESMTQLTVLKLDDTFVANSDLVYISNLNTLTSLSLSDTTGLTDITPLIGLSNLKSLFIVNAELNLITGTAQGDLNLAAINELSLQGTYVNHIGNVSNDMEVYFADAMLDTAIRAMLKKSSGVIFANELAVITSLNLTGLGVSDLSGIGYCTELEYLFAQSNQISNIAALKNLTKLKQVMLSYNNIRDFSLLGNLSSLTYINMSDNNAAINSSSIEGMNNMAVVDDFINQGTMVLWENGNVKD